MKITAGLGSVDEYIPYAEAGADEFFCGYVPYGWTEKYGTVLPLNRREVLFYNVQLGAFSELEILAKIKEQYGKPVHITLNSLYYLPEQYALIKNIIVQCMSLGFQSFIIADPALILYLREQNINCEIHLSGENGEVNSQMMKFFAPMNLKRIIFHRKNTLEDMNRIISAERKTEEKNLTENRKKMEFEAFILNEMCHFTGAYCNSLHCDELGHLCRVPYKLGMAGEEDGKNRREPFPDKKELEDAELPGDEEGYLCGRSGCGLCALYKMQAAGVTHLKLVGRGNYSDFMKKDIQNLRKVLDILERSESEEKFRLEMKKRLFSGNCSGNCYYRQI